MRIKTNNRNSSVELFRILSIFLVLIVHFNGWFVGGMPDCFDFNDISTFRVGQVIIQSLSVVCVNSFLIISGWYGINLKPKSIWNFYIQLVSIYVPFYLAYSIYTEQFSWGGVINNTLALSKNSYFVNCYLMLIFLSPILNSFIERYGKKVIKYAVLLLAIEFWFDCIRSNEHFNFNGGYALSHFVLMYLLARGCYFHKESILKYRKWIYILGYLGCTAIIAVMYLIGIKWCYDYSNPINILASFCLFFPFLYRNYTNKYINYIASSGFAVYLMHTSAPLITVLWKTDNYLLRNCEYYQYLLACAFIIIVVFISCILYDKLMRGFILGKLTDKIYSYLDKKIIQKIR